MALISKSSDAPDDLNYIADGGVIIAASNLPLTTDDAETLAVANSHPYLTVSENAPKSAASTHTFDVGDEK